MLAGGLLLGTLGVFLEEAGQHPLTAVWFRCAFGWLALSAALALTGRWRDIRLSPPALRAAVAGGLLMLLNWALFFSAIQRTSIALATVVFHVQPFIVMALAAWWWREPVRRTQWAAAAVALVGLALAAGAASAGGAGGSAASMVGLVMCLGGAFSYALVVLLAKAVSAQGGSALAMAWWQCGVGTVALAWWPLREGWPALGAAWGWLAGLGVLHTGLAYVLLYAGMARLGAGQVAVLQFVYPITAVAMDAMVYGRRFTPAQALGLALMMAALWVALRPAPQRGAQAGPSAAPARPRPGASAGA
jgi:drug/metabolite transporter (DMT)-like permease